MNPPPPTHELRRDLAQLAGLAFAYRLLFLIAVPRVLDTADAIHYVETAASFASGIFLGHDPKIPPFYPLLGALFSKLPLADLEWGCRLVSFAAATLLVIPVYLLAREIHGRSTARVAGLVVALWPWLADYGCSVSTESLAALLWLTAVYLLVRGARRGGWALYGGAAAFCALSLTRPEGLFLFMCAAPAVAILLWPPDRASARRLAPLAIVFALFIMASTAFNQALAGRATANYRVGFILAEFDWVRFAHTGVETLSNVVPVMLGPVLFFFLGAGFLLPRQRPRDFRLECCVLLFAFAQWAVSLFVLSPAPRYLMAPLIVFSLWSASGIVLTSARLAQADHGARLLRLIPLLAIIAFQAVQAAITIGSEHLGRLPREPREYKLAGQWMSENLAHGLIFTRKPQVGFYAGMPSTGPAEGESLEAMLNRARAAGARYLVVDERYTAAMAPPLRPLLDPANAPADLTHLQSFEPWPGGRVTIYEIAGAQAP
ncbi:MAG: glycosyltransferase family 39 protein [Candidatus Hydrogenedentes bacterium]|nr:glycosyltransferase family 39 protein [Candidatus Hydrogenedentota bacterium]